ncbi:MAG: MBL fold metallo-hydrolase [Nitrososphaeraceae archaeon]
MSQEHVTLKNIQDSHFINSPKATATERTIIQDQLMVRINGTLPDISTLGSEEKSERAAEVKKGQDTSTNTSCSIYAEIEKGQKMFHLLVDIGQGVVKSIEKDIGFKSSSTTSLIPNALLITHLHDDHIKELPMLVDKFNEDNESRRKNLMIFCTMECRDQIIKKFPQLSEKTGNNNGVSFSVVQPDESFQVGPFSVMAILADHGDNSPPGSVIYIVKLLDKKIIVGWDFLSLPNVNENLLWKPDVLILGTQTYNPHPETGMICVSDAYDLVRRWNAKECYIVHYSGSNDFEEASNQWFRGPVKAMTTDELQSVIDSHLQVTGDNGKFRIRVAEEGMVWTGKEEEKEGQQQPQLADESKPIGKVLEIESLQKYILKIENVDTDHKLKLILEDAVNRFNFEFVRPVKDGNSDDILYAEGEKGMMAKGPQLRMEIVRAESQNESSIIKIRVSKGAKKDVFKDDIYVNNTDAQRLKLYIKENFVAGTK